MQAQLSVRNQITPDVLLLEFSLQSPLDFQAGQFFPLTAINPPLTDNRGNLRNFGFVNSPVQNNLISMITHNGTSSYKQYLLSAPLGTEFEIGDPKGEMILPEDLTRPLVFITSDIGIAPYISILRYAQDRALPYQITVINLPPVLFISDLNTYGRLNPRYKLLTPDSLDTFFLRDQFPEPGNLLFYITGLPHFVTNTVRILHEWGLPPTQMKFEIFTGY
jgi:ferredoxin-NADP reductase